MYSLTGPVGQLFASLPLGGDSGSRPGDTPTFLELGSPVSNVSLQIHDPTWQKGDLPV
jgi:hypothetical protein